MSARRPEMVAVSHRGRRAHQEDEHLCRKFGDLVVMAVADGMGGHAAGEVASRIVVQEIENAARSGRLSPEDEAAIQEVARTANEQVLAYGREHIGASGLGSTLVAALVSGNEALVAHAGDSRAFLVCNDELIQLTRDHSAVQDALDAGTIDEVEARTSPYRHAVLRNIGDEAFPGLEVARVSLPEGSILLLTSDGVHGFLTEAEILGHLAGTADLRTGVAHLLRLAHHNGSDDNMTLVGCETGSYRRSEVASQVPPKIRRPARPRAASRLRRPIVLSMGVLLVVLAALTWTLASRQPSRREPPPENSASRTDVPVSLDGSASGGEQGMFDALTWTTPVPSVAAEEGGERELAGAQSGRDREAETSKVRGEVGAALESEVGFEPTPTPSPGVQSIPLSAGEVIGRVPAPNLLQPVPIPVQAQPAPTPADGSS